MSEHDDLGGIGIRKSLLPAAQAKLDKLNKRCTKLDLPMLTLRVLREWVQDEPSASDPFYALYCEGLVPASACLCRPVTYVEVVVDGPAPKIAGWSFVASLERTDAGTIVRSAPGQEDIVTAEMRERPTWCDHCNTERRRKDTFVVQHDDGTLMQVGRTCLKDFLGHSPSSVLWFMEQRGGLDPDDLGGVRVEEDWPLPSFLGWVVKSMREHGWVSRSEARDNWDKTATSDDAEDTWEKIAGRIRKAGALRRNTEPEMPTDDDVAQAAAALAWVRGGDFTDTSEYAENLRTVCALDWITRRQMGLAASVVRAHQRALDRIAEREARVELPPVAGPEGRVEVEGEIVSMKWIDSDYGSTLKLLLVVPHLDGAFKVWCSSPKSLGTVERGDRVRMTLSLERSHDDAAFLFGKRPSKAEHVVTDTQGA